MKQENFFAHLSGLEANRDEIPEVLDYFKYSFKSGVEETRPLRNDEGRAYITYLDENGNQKEMKYMYNAKEADMEKSERERYLAEVKKADELLQTVIDEYQKTGQNQKHAVWSKVKVAMRERVEIDKKYNVSKNQQKVTESDIRETLDETIETSEFKGLKKNAEGKKDKGYDRYDDMEERGRYR